MEYMRPFTFNGVTFLIGAASLVPVILIFEKQRPDADEKKRLWKYGLICGLILFAAGNLQQFGVDLTGSAGKSGFITGLYIIIVPIAGVFLKQPTNRLTWAGAGLAVVGMYFLTVQEALGKPTAGDWLLFLGAFFWAAHIIAVGKFAPHVSALRLSQIQFIICGALCMLFAVTTEVINPALLLMAAVPLLYRSLASIGVAYTLQIVGQRHVTPSKAAVIFSLETVFSVLGGAVLINEIMTGRAYFGCALIFCGIILSQLKLKARH